ncbi:Protein YIPF3 [Trichinella zimbabwensis]|uniref:Protein YIPF3 n=1 Tax=Trichinella zimbabwensis TaxID=268475 RepID=A0A0V1HXN9_9BILA|nr:Protein YIPF3 [Trichinella zimbabwensis]
MSCKSVRVYMEPPLKVSSRYAAEDFVSEGEIPSSKVEKNDTGQRFNANLTKMVIEAGSEHIKKAVSIYINVDFLRPYFDVTPVEVVHRLLNSVIPMKRRIMVKNDLYGPLMLIFTLVALLLWGMKNSDYKVKDRTLIGTALATATSYWLFASVCLFAFCLYSSSNYSFIGVLSTVGYSMFSHCIVLAITEIVHLLFHSHYFFHFCALTIGSMAAGKLVVYFFHGAYRNWDRFVLVAVVLFLHMGFLYYLHFGFHRVVEEITEILGEDVTKVALLITTTIST